MGTEGLESLTVAELRARAAELEVKGRSSMSREELVAAIGDAQSGEPGPPYEQETGGGRSPDGEKPASEIPAPSIGPNTVIEKKPPEERLDHDKISDVDAMGLDKRRSVVGHSYSASLTKQIALYAIFVAVVAALAFGGKMLVDEADAPPAEYEDRAPWSDPNARQVEPNPIQ